MQSATFVNSTNLVCWACEKQNENLLKECIESKYNLNEETLFQCNSALMIAAEDESCLNMVKLLVNNGADLHYVNYRGRSVLSSAADEEYFQSIGLLEAPEIGMSQLAYDISCKNKCKPTTKEEVNQVDALGLTPFLWAIYHNRQNYIDYYMELGADVNKAGKTGITPLMMAAARGNSELLKKLVERGAKVNQLDRNGMSAVAYVHFGEPVKFFDYLIAHGAQLENGKSALMISAIQNDEIFIDYFLNKNANVNFIDTDGNSVLSYAILNENLKNAEKLIAKGANVNLCGPKGKPPLVWAVFVNNTKISHFLLDNGAKINCTDHQGRTALYYAEKYEYFEIVELLKENGA